VNRISDHYIGVLDGDWAGGGATRVSIKSEVCLSYFDTQERKKLKTSTGGWTLTSGNKIKKIRVRNVMTDSDHSF